MHIKEIGQLNAIYDCILHPELGETGIKKTEKVD